MQKMMNSNSNMETRSLLDDLRNLDEGGLFDLGHPLLNRMAESFVKAAGIGAIQAVSREAYLNAVEGAGMDYNGMPDTVGSKKRRLPDLKGETSKKSLEAMVKSTGKESIQWGLAMDCECKGIINCNEDLMARHKGLAAGMYSGITYGLKEARGAHDWKNSAVAGAVTGAAMAFTLEDTSHEQVVRCAITGAALSTAANLLSGIF